MAEEKFKTLHESRHTLTDDQITTERTLRRRSFLTAAGALVAGGAVAIALGGSADAVAQSSDPDKVRDPDKIKDPNKARDPGKVRDPNKVRDPDKVRDPNKAGDPDKVRDPDKMRHKPGDPDRKKHPPDPGKHQ